jgi:hypothetical protein
MVNDQSWAACVTARHFSIALMTAIVLAGVFDEAVEISF